MKIKEIGEFGLGHELEPVHEQPRHLRRGTVGRLMRNVDEDFLAVGVRLEVLDHLLELLARELHLAASTWHV